MILWQEGKVKRESKGFARRVENVQHGSIKTTRITNTASVVTIKSGKKTIDNRPPFNLE
jgi:hypothetical protein